MIIVLACGWGPVAAVALATSSNWIKLPFENVVGLASFLSLGVFFLLERNFWLSRFMGLRIPAGLPWQVSAVILWLFGIVGLLLRSTTRPQTASDARGKTQAAEHLVTDSVREVVETIVFVVVLVLLLKSFVAEAFVIPTGSMAETLYGYQKIVQCPRCEIKFPVNCSKEVDPSDEPPADVIGCTCPNCRFHILLVGLPGSFRQPGRCQELAHQRHHRPGVEERRPGAGVQVRLRPARQDAQPSRRRRLQSSPA